MRRIKGIVRTVVAIAGAISLNSPIMMGMVAAGPGFASELNGLEDVSCKIGSQPTDVDQPVTMRGRIGRFERKGTGVDSRRG
jgi:hypothetical protein